METLEAVTALLSHAIPSGNINAVLETVLTDALERLVKRRFGARGKATRGALKRAHQLSPGAVPIGDDQLSPGTVPMGDDQLSPGTVAGNRTRYITADVRGAVYVRDGGRCDPSVIGMIGNHSLG